MVRDKIKLVQTNNNYVKYIRETDRGVGREKVWDETVLGPLPKLTSFTTAISNWIGTYIE